METKARRCKPASQLRSLRIQVTCTAAEAAQLGLGSRLSKKYKLSQFLREAGIKETLRLQAAAKRGAA